MNVTGAGDELEVPPIVLDGTTLILGQLHETNRPLIRIVNLSTLRFRDEQFAMWVSHRPLHPCQSALEDQPLAMGSRSTTLTAVRNEPDEYSGGRLESSEFRASDVFLRLRRCWRSRA